jgi:hypothetical protein
MRVFDAHRIVGPQPATGVGETTADLLDRLAWLGIDGAAVTYSRHLKASPYASSAEIFDPKVIPVPVLVPGVANSGFPTSIECLSGVGMVRVCPVLNRFDPLGSVATGWWQELADRRVAVAIDANEVGLDLVGRIAEATPSMRMLVLTPGYRELRRLGELLSTFDGVHIETGTLVAAGAIEWLARNFGPERLVFGTGAPTWDDAGPRFQLDHLELPARDVQLIAADNAERLIRGRA